MSYLLFMDESGHDHRQMPYEVRGGVALHASQVWPFLTSVRRLEEELFGLSFAQLGLEIKGQSLLSRKRFRFAGQSPPIEPGHRRALAGAFLRRSQAGQNPSRNEFSAHGQASLDFVDRLLSEIKNHNGVVFASMIPRGKNSVAERDDSDLVRKDQQELFARYFRFLEENSETGLLILDESDRTDDKRYLERLEDYFTNSLEGQILATRLVPAPMFVASEMSVAIQVADVVIYCINWAFRDPKRGIDSPFRDEIAQISHRHLESLQFQSQEGAITGSVQDSYSIFCVAELYKQK